MLGRQLFSFQVHQNVVSPYHKITIEAPWRRVRYVLDELRDVPVDVRKAHITAHHSTLYVKGAQGERLSEEAKLEVYARLQEGIDLHTVEEQESQRSYAAQKLAMSDDVNVSIYNVSNTNYTLLEFSCGDRVGLLTDILNLLASLPVDIETGHISSVGNVAHNIFYLRRHDRALNDGEIQYVSNIFEHQCKDDLQTPSDM